MSEYKKACAIATDKGLPLPDPPSNLNGLAKDFFTDITVVNQEHPFSRAANLLYRREVYAAHNNAGKSHLWITVSPPDHESRKIMFYALPEDKFAPHKDQVPDASFRFKTLSQNPVAAALHFELVLETLIEHLIGWDTKHKGPKKDGGLFGIPKCWLRVVEEQGTCIFFPLLLLSRANTLFHMQTKMVV